MEAGGNLLHGHPTIVRCGISAVCGRGWCAISADGRFGICFSKTVLWLFASCQSNHCGATAKGQTVSQVAVSTNRVLLIVDGYRREPRILEESSNLYRPRIQIANLEH